MLSYDDSQALSAASAAPRVKKCTASHDGVHMPACPHTHTHARARTLVGQAMHFMPAVLQCWGLGEITMENGKQHARPRLGGRSAPSAQCRAPHGTNHPCVAARVFMRVPRKQQLSKRLVQRLSIRPALPNNPAAATLCSPHHSLALAGRIHSITLIDTCTCANMRTAS